MNRARASRAATRGQRRRRQTAEGMLVLLEESHELPIVDIHLAIRTGGASDPQGQEGLARLTARMVRMGTRALDANEVEEAIAQLGARLSIDPSPSVIRFHGTVIRRNLDAFMALLASLLREPAFRAHDFAHVKRETLTDIIAARDHDRALAARHFRQAIFGDHVYARSVLGTRSSLRAIKRADVTRHYREHFVPSNMVLGVAGDVSARELERLLVQHWQGGSPGRAPRRRLTDPKRAKGRRVIIVDKPARTQTQLFVGTLGSKVTDADIDAMVVANTAFGGTFTARLMNEVRVKRGWSYGAYSRLSQDRARDAWYMWTFPAAKDVADCLALELDMLEAFVADGITPRELRFAKRYLKNGHCFDVDTAAKRLDARMDCELYALPQDHWKRFVARVGKVKLDETQAAVRRRLSSRDVTIALVATAKDVRKRIEGLPGVSDVKVVPYDRD